MKINGAIIETEGDPGPGFTIGNARGAHLENILALNTPLHIGDATNATIKNVQVVGVTAPTGRKLKQGEFLPTKVGNRSEDFQEFTFGYKKGVPPTLVRMYITGEDAPNFKIETATCPENTKLTEKTSCSFRISFNPASVGHKLARVNVEMIEEDGKKTRGVEVYGDGY